MRHALSLVLAAGALCLAAPAAADTPPGGQSQSKSWLRPSNPGPALATRQGPSPWRVVLMLGALGALGGAVVYARKRKGPPAITTQPERLQVLGSTRVGPKAFAVVAEVAGKRLLLGVTDQSVNTLAWLDSAPLADEADEPALARRDSSPSIEIERSVPDESPSGFLKLLRSTVGSRGRRSQAPADQIAEATRDEVRVTRRTAPEPEPLEGQVLGLARRRRQP